MYIFDTNIQGGEHLNICQPRFYQNNWTQIYFLPTHFWLLSKPQKCNILLEEIIIGFGDFLMIIVHIEFSQTWGVNYFIFDNIWPWLDPLLLGSYFTYLVQLNKYETAPNFIQWNQNLTSDCLLIYLFLPVLAWADHKICFVLIYRQILWSAHARIGKFS